MTSAGIEIQGLTKRFTHRRGAVVEAIRHIDLTVAPGEFLAIVGPSGCGKSTLLHLVAGLEQPSGGAVRIGGEPPRELVRKHRLGVAFQDPALLPWLSVQSNLGLPFKLAAMPVDREKVTALIKLVGLKGFEHARPSQLSGGMRQRAAIARSLCLDPDVLLLDEPFGALDAVTRRRLNIELERIWRDRPITTLLVTHSVEEALFLSDRTIVMERPGAIAQVVQVPFLRPRTPDVLRLEEFHRLTDQITLWLEH
ncbi:MAG TPA: ABC transporter ATP-binding protein [Candidatus Acidoferrum sp.]|nr:ABC transporter ATP-binding protein [Candidatus Acidoferrum sp.]